MLAGTLETAVNALWDAGPLLGDRVAVVGAGMVGCCVARLLARMPGVEVTLVDVDPSRAAVADALGVGFARPTTPPDGPRPGGARQRHVRRAPALARPARRRTARVLDLSWYGDRRRPARRSAAPSTRAA